MKDSKFRQFLESHTPVEIVEKLTHYLTDRRKEVIESSLENRLTSVQVAAEAPYDIHNALAIIRTAEAFGMSDVHIIAPELQEGRGIGTSKGAIRWVNVHRYKTLDDFQPKQMVLAGAVIDGECTLEELPVDQPLMLMFGNEQRGLSKEARERCDLLFHIPMQGVSDSLNLSVAAAISLYDVTKRRRKFLKKMGDLSEERKEIERARHYLRTVGARVSEQLLQKS